MISGRYFTRQSGQPVLRNKSWLDGQTFRISRGRQVAARGGSAWLPLQSHWRPATCAEAQCPYYTNGWVTVIDLTPQQDRQQLEERQYASRLLHQSDWSFRVEWDGSREIFHFEAGQDHYAKIDRGHRHWVPIERDPIFLLNARQLDYDQFFDQFNEHSYQLYRRQQEG